MYPLPTGFQMIILKRNSDIHREIIDWLAEHVAPSAKEGYEPVWGSPYSQKVEWRAQNHTWRIMLDDKAQELAITVMDATKENVLRSYLEERQQS